MRSHATVVRREDWTGELLPELQETTVEIGTPICASAVEAQTQLERLRLQAGTVAAAHGLMIVAAGTHPFSAWQGHERPPLERYRGIEARYGRIARDEHIFGMHVHVTAPTGADRLVISNVVRHYLPHLLALSVSSPFYEGEDTGFASYRSILWRRWPNSGIPPRFASEAEFDRYIALLLDAGALADAKSLYWSLRPHPAYPTLEFRVMDVCPNVRDAAAVAALARVLVHAAMTGRLSERTADHFNDALVQELLRANEWSTARYGLDAQWIDTVAGGGEQPMRTAIRRLLERVARSAEELGDADILTHIETVLTRGTAADRMRAAYTERNMTELVDWLIEETLLGTGLDRRAVQRGEA